MYIWRKLDDKQRKELLAFRQLNDRPWHSPSHRVAQNGRYLLSASCYEHRPWIGKSPQRMGDFASRLLETMEPHCQEINAWCVLPNHYHALVFTLELPDLLGEIGRLHGRTAFIWNGEDAARGRKVWFNCAETCMKTERHFWATLNYVHHNPVHHGYVKRWQVWPFSSANAFLASASRQMAEEIWRMYPVLDYGKEWDPPEL